MRGRFAWGLVIFAMACGDDSDPGDDAAIDAAAIDAATDAAREDAGETDAARDQGVDADEFELPLPLPSVDVEGLAAPTRTDDPYAVHVAADRTMVATGGSVTLTARVVRAAAMGTPTFAWTLSGGTADTTSGSTITVTYADAGEFTAEVVVSDDRDMPVAAGALITVIVPGAFHVGDVDGDGSVDSDDVIALQAQLDGTTPLGAEALDRADVDLNGRINAEDEALVDQAARDGDDAPTTLIPARGRLGTRLLIVDPALLDPAALATVTVGASAPQPVTRVRPGYGTAFVPPDVGFPGIRQVQLLIEGTAASTFPFEVAPEGGSSPDGAGYLTILERTDDLLAEFPELVDRYLRGVGATLEERVSIRGLSAVAAESFTRQRVAFVDAYMTMEPSAREAYESIARGNGLDNTLLDRLTRLEAEVGGLEPLALSPERGEVVLDVLCTALDIADLSSDIAEINEAAAGFIDSFDFFPVNLLPGVGAVIRFLSGLSSAIGAITDVVGIVAEFLPEIGDVEVVVERANLTVGQATPIRGELEIVSLTKLCGKAADAAIGSIVDQLQDALTLRLARSIPGVGRLFRGRFDRDRAGVVAGLVFDVVGLLSSEILNIAGVEDQLRGLADRICGLLDDPRILLPSDLMMSCGDVAGGMWPCTAACVGSVTGAVDRTFCDERRMASSAIQCAMGDGGMDAGVDAGGRDGATTGGGMCNCGSEGVRFVPGPDCFPDANECSGWQSVVIQNEFGGDFSPENEAAAAEFLVSSGTELCAFGCCITIEC
ncbi:MAG: PKD domain-containing protein [Myxococcota bacterium]